MKGNRLHMSSQENSYALLYFHCEIKVWFDSCVLSYWNVAFQVKLTVLSGFNLYASLLFSAKAACLNIRCF